MMKTCYMALVASIVLMVAGQDLLAQRPGGQRGQGGPGAGQDGGPRGGAGQRGQGRGGPGAQGRGGPGQMSPLMALLDTNRDGVLSKDEIAKASAVLAKLDTDKDGNVTPREVYAAVRELGPRGPRDGAPRDGGPAAGGPRDGGPGPRDGGPGAGPGSRNPRDIIARIKELDEDGDGTISKDEVPERMQQFFDRMDTNGDGSLSAEEMRAVAERMGRGRGPAAGGGDRPARPDRPGRPGADDDK